MARLTPEEAAAMEALALQAEGKPYYNKLTMNDNAGDRNRLTSIELSDMMDPFDVRPVDDAAHKLEQLRSWGHSLPSANDRWSPKIIKPRSQ
jgi:hypothetical protein